MYVFFEDASSRTA